MTEIRPFLCDNIDRALVRSEWEKWHRSFSLYLQAEDINDEIKKKNKLLHLGDPQLQEVAFNIPGALVESDGKTNVFKVLVDKLDEYFSPKRNSTFERHLFRNLSPSEGENFNKYLLRLRNQVSKCEFGKTASEIIEICVKDKIIDSWAPVDLKRKLLEKEQSLNEIIESCQIYEQISKQSGSMFTKPSEEKVNRISAKTSGGRHELDECMRCGRKGHGNKDLKCPARFLKCNKCGLVGHFARKCKTKKRKHNSSGHSSPKKRSSGSFRVRNVEEESEPEEEVRELNCFKITNDASDDENLRCDIGGCGIPMIIDSGTRFNLVSENDFKSLKNNAAVLWNERKDSSTHFIAYASNQTLSVLRVFEAPIGIRNVERIATFYVIKNGCQSLLGRDTATKLGVLRLGTNVNRVDRVEPFPKMLGVEIKLSINPDVKPVQQAMRRVPVALEKKVEDKIDQMLALDIIEPVSGPTSWISPIVIVVKEGGEMRLCIDMRRANQAVLRENYPLPTFEVFMTKLRRAKFFSRIDLKWAYHQLELDKSSRHITTFISHKGVFQYKRLMFGINSAPEIFQRVIEKLLCSCKNALNYIDDIIIFGRTEQEHDEAVKKVVDVFKNNNLLLNEAKCVWKVRQLKFLGHLLSDGGIAPDPSKVQTIRDFRAPQSKEELRSFLGLVTYVGKFIPDLASTTESLRCLLKLNCKFTWGEPQKDAFNKLKLALSEIPKLAYFDPNKKTRVIADASPVALGAVLLQTDLAGEAQVISFASKSLSDTEKRYSQTEKESLALVWAVERYYYYLMGLEFELVTDHKPLETIFKPTSKPPARIERWLLRLQPFKFKVIYRPGKENIADSVSRLCKVVNASTFDNDHNHNIFHIVESSIPSAMGICEIAKESAKDQELVNAASYVKDGLWETNKTSTFYPFRYELSAVGDILLRGTRIVIPKTLREQTLQLAHEGHPGESAMKRRLRSKVWWPLIDRDAESFVKRCVDCLLVSQPNKPASMQRHSFPNGPWQCVATDLLGPLPNDEYVRILVLIDYYSRYQEVKFTKRITSEAIISILREIFSRLGIPNSLRADNGRQFVSAEFKSFCQTHNMELITTPPYWPQANGEVENMNRSLVKRLIIAHNNKRDYKKEIQDFTLMYNVTPHGTTGTSPSELMFNRVIRDKIPGIQDLTGDMLDSAARDLDMINKWKGKEKADTKRGAKEPVIEVGDKVLLRNVIFPHKLTPTFDPTEYVVKEVNGNEVTIAANGKSLRRNISHVKRLPVTKNANPSVSGEHQNAAGLTTPVTTTTTVPAKVASDMVPQSEASSATPHKAVTVSSSTIPTASNS